MNALAYKLTRIDENGIMQMCEPHVAFEPVLVRRAAKDQWWNDGDNEARARKNGPPKLTPEERMRHGAGNGGAERRATMERIALAGLDALGEGGDRYMFKRIVSRDFVFASGRLAWRTICDCGKEGTVLCAQWNRRDTHLGGSCVECGRKRQKTHGRKCKGEPLMSVYKG